MHKICSNCKSSVISNCDVHEYMGCNIVVSKKGEGFFNEASESLKAYVCTECGNVSFYIDQFKDFKRFID